MKGGADWGVRGILPRKILEFLVLGNAISGILRQSQRVLRQVQFVSRWCNSLCRNFCPSLLLCMTLFWLPSLT